VRRQPIERRLVRAGHALEQIAPGRQHAAVGADEHADADCRRDLRRLREVARDVDADLARHERDDAPVERAAVERDAHHAELARAERAADDGATLPVAHGQRRDGHVTRGAARLRRAVSEPQGSGAVEAPCQSLRAGHIC